MRTLANWPLRAKLLAVLALPTIAAVALAAARIYDGVAETSSYQRSVDAIGFDYDATEVTHALQHERVAMASWIVGGRAPGHGELDKDISATDSTWDRVKGANQEVDVAEPAIQRIQPRMTALDRLRKMAMQPGGADTAAISVSTMNSAYGSVIDTLLQPTYAGSSAELRDNQNAVNALEHAKEDASTQNLYLTLGAMRGRFADNEGQLLNEAGADLVSSISRFNDIGPDDDKRAYAGEMTGVAVNNQFQLQQLAVQRAGANLPTGIDTGQVVSNADAISQKFANVLDRAFENLKSTASGMLSSARTSLIVTASVLAVALFITLMLMFFVARTMLRQLRTLRRTALRVASEQLPATVHRILSDPDPREAARTGIKPVGVHTTEEIGQVARSFDEVHSQAVRLATEQALLRDNLNRILVNLSRRSQVLVQRQLGVIDRLEDREQDPDRLTDLFELDHLSTRLRRNGESLLVLSGSGPANQITRPTRAADIIGAAVSETEDYRRVDVGTVPDVSVHGQAVHDLVHLLAELLDNATFFSEQSTTVRVRAAMNRHSELAIQITDTGVGMTEEQLAAANQALSEPPDLDVAVTRRMGHYVVARLGKRHGIEVRLAENEDIEGGLVARIKVPAKLLTDKARASSGLPPQVSVRQLSRSGFEEEDAEFGSGDTGAEWEPAEIGGSGFETVPAQRDADEDAHSMVVPPDLPGKRNLEENQAELPALDAPLHLDALGSGPIYTDQPASVAEDGSGAKAANNGNGSTGNGRYAGALDENTGKRHEELVRKGTPIYQEMMSRWLSETTETDVFTALDESGNPKIEWREESDSGWHAAALLGDIEPEQNGQSALPKRVPNAYLVPGSLDSGAHHLAAEQLPEDAEQAANVARDKMARFQSGFVAGRKAVGHSVRGSEGAEQGNPFGLTDKE
ncbi:nitrate- and nitrite sensing domain-containing protein, partial [Sciscionella sediminilitoris]|uniref:nitrate- and nitrite sensing domain-containing protein n=1 Tax=Sciscionella sediminilitoris TaxID=1445613 RepID=UPI0005670958